MSFDLAILSQKLAVSCVVRSLAWPLSQGHHGLWQCLLDG